MNPKPARITPIRLPQRLLLLHVAQETQPERGVAVVDGTERHRPLPVGHHVLLPVQAPDLRLQAIGAHAALVRLPSLLDGQVQLAPHRLVGPGLGNPRRRRVHVEAPR